VRATRRDTLWPRVSARSAAPVSGEPDTNSTIVDVAGDVGDLRAKSALRSGQMGLSVAFDLATHRGYDSDPSRAIRYSVRQP
jgi:methylmalonyl-CoA mutase N-terminal domain/subunit